MKKTAIIIPCFNRLEFTKKCINSIFRYTRSPFELIVVDNGSSDGTNEWLKENGPGLKLISKSSNEGAPKAFNAGIKSANSDYVVLLNNDTIVTDGWLERLISLAESSEDIALVGPCSNQAGELPADINSVDEIKIQRDAAVLYLSRKKESIEVPGITSFCMLVKSCIFPKVGYFDENYGYGTNDDHDFCIRVRDAGYRIVCAMDTLVFHYYSRTLGKFDIKGLDRRNREYLVWKFKERGIKYLREVNQPYGSRGERSFEEIRKMKEFL
ncbi:MAG: glycosyltransferase family 2 protein [Elusimicrobiota bacterium]